MKLSNSRSAALARRHRRVRKKVNGTPERPRLCVHKSQKHIYAQLVDDRAGLSLAFATTNTKGLKASAKCLCNIESAKKLGAEFGKAAAAKGFKAVVFDRGGYPYHGVVKAFADAAREAGLQF